MELFTTIAVTVGVFVLLAAWVLAFLMIKTDVFAGPRAESVAPVTPESHPVHDDAPRELVHQ